MEKMNGTQQVVHENDYMLSIQIIWFVFEELIHIELAVLHDKEYVLEIFHIC